MRVHLTILFIILLFAMTGISCNKNTGCPASQVTQKNININNEKDGMFNGRKAKKSRKSSVMPQEIRIKRK